MSLPPLSSPSHGVWQQEMKPPCWQWHWQRASYVGSTRHSYHSNSVTTVRAETERSGPYLQRTDRHGDTTGETRRASTPRKKNTSSSSTLFRLLLLFLLCSSSSSTLYCPSVSRKTKKTVSRSRKSDNLCHPVALTEKETQSYWLSKVAVVGTTPQFPARHQG